jgi:transposase-like protein
MTKKKCKIEKMAIKKDDSKYKCKKCQRESTEKKELCKPKKKDPKT